MTENDDSLDLDGDGKFTVVDMAILDDEEKQRTSGNKNSGCCIAVLVLGASALLSIWGITRIT